jgi:hypothetical protein
MPSRPDYVNDLADGATEQYAFRVHPPGLPGDLAWTRRIISPDGRTLEVWHEVADHTGRLVHSHRHL